MTAPRSALVTGGTGFIGSALVARLVAEGIRVYCLVRHPAQDRVRADRLRGAELIDISSFDGPGLQRALAGVAAEAVFHLAAYGVDQQDRDTEAMVEGNVQLVTRMIEATAHWPLRRFIHTGSCSEYGGSGDVDHLTEETPLRPMSIYGAAKAASVLYGTALAFHKKVPFLTLRLFGAYGVGEAPHRIVSHVMAHLQGDQPVDLTSGEQMRDFLYIDDLAEAFFRAALAERLQNWEVYNVCSAHPLMLRTLLETVADEMGKPRELLRWGQKPYRPDEPMRIVGDNRRFVEATGWTPRTSLRDGVRAMQGSFSRGES